MSQTQPERTIKPVDLDAEIGRRVHQLMWDRKITQTEFGQIIGMDQSSVAKRFRGKLGWSATQVKAAASALDCSVAYLYGETSSTAPIDPVGPGRIELPTSTV